MSKLPLFLQQDGHNIFSNLSAADYRKNLKYIRHCIIATDLVTFFPNEKKLRELIKTNMFDILEESHQWVNRSVSYLPFTIGRKELVSFDKNNGQSGIESRCFSFAASTFWTHSLIM